MRTASPASSASVKPDGKGSTGTTYRTRAHISNPAVKVFCAHFGREYDKLRNLEPYNTSKDFAEVLKFFDGCCCYCGCSGDGVQWHQDHLVPLNRKYMGLHAWGNVVPACGMCNGKKRERVWSDYLATCAATNMAERYKRINDFVAYYKYQPNVQELKAIAEELYEEIGRIAQTLIDIKIARCANLLSSA